MAGRDWPGGDEGTGAPPWWVAALYPGGARVIRVVAGCRGGYDREAVIARRYFGRLGFIRATFAAT